jgi:hypothetical protein
MREGVEGPSLYILPLIFSKEGKGHMSLLERLRYSLKDI